MKCLSTICLIISLALAAAAQDRNNPSSVQAVVPHLIRFSGQVKSDSGVVGVTFTLHKSQDDNQALWVETQNVKLDSNGRYTVLLGATKSEGVPVDLFTSGDAQWLGIRVEGQAEQPRVLLVSVPYALRAAEADTLSGHVAADFVTTDKLHHAVQEQLQQQPDASTAARQAKNSTAGTTVTTNTATNFTDTNTTQVVAVTQKGTGQALKTTALDTSLVAVSTATTGSYQGIQGHSYSANGIGIYGLSHASSGSTYGVEGSAASPSGIGVYGFNASPSGNSFGVMGQTASTSGTALYGYEYATSGATTGVLASVKSKSGTAAVLVNSSSGKLISGKSGASPATEVFSVDGNGLITAGNATFGGNANSTAPGIQVNGFTEGDDVPGAVITGFAGFTFGGTGIVAQGGSSGDAGADGIDATAFPPQNQYAPGSYAGNFKGDLNVTGVITAGTKDFKIDHPLDPANKYLYHAAVESSEMKDIYDGSVTTDEKGEAVVHLPDWFETVNGDFRYQLTVIGQFAQAIVSTKIKDHAFSIRTDKPNVEVSWQVTGVRHDAFAQAHPLQVEVQKPSRERGYYIHPELYGADSRKQIEWARHPQQMKMMQDALQEQARQKKP